MKEKTWRILQEVDCLQMYIDTENLDVFFKVRENIRKELNNENEV
jgi:hypothetical protein